MAVNSVLGTQNTGVSQATSQSTKDQLSMSDFMNLMVQQLEHQDPTNPTDANAFFSQMAQLGTVQGMDNLNKQANVSQAQALMGKVVTAARPNADGTNGADTVTGVVTQMTAVNGQYKLGVQDFNGGLVQVNMDSIQSVTSDANLSSFQGLVGQNVTGLAMVTTNGVSDWAAVTGTVSGLYSSNNQNYAQVETADGTKVNMLVGDIRTIGKVGTQT